MRDLSSKERAPHGLRATHGTSGPTPLLSCHPPITHTWIIAVRSRLVHHCGVPDCREPRFAAAAPVSSAEPSPSNSRRCTDRCNHRSDVFRWLVCHMHLNVPTRRKIAAGLIQSCNTIFGLTLLFLQVLREAPLVAIAQRGRPEALQEPRLRRGQNGMILGVFFSSPSCCQPHL